MARIIVENLVKKLSNKIVLNNISFQIANGLFAYIGPNGSGKTTTVRLCLGILKPTSGEIKILKDDGFPVLNSEIGFVLENESPFENFTPQEYLEFYAEIYGVVRKEEKISELLEKIGLASRRKEKIAKFSKGMKRKLCIIKSLMGDPQVLFLDEPFEGVEIEARRELKNILLEIKSEKIIFVTTHNLPEIESMCDAFGIIINGSFAGPWEREALSGRSLENFYFSVRNTFTNEGLN
ncbi:MAG: ABC transporter ATP-binding protein [bacterium]